MQSDDMDRDEAPQGAESPPVLGKIPGPVVEAMSLVMQEAHRAAAADLKSAKQALAADRAAFEAQRTELESSLSEAKAAVEAEKAAHQQTIENSESLRSAAQQHNDVVTKLQQERDALQQRCIQLETQVAELSDKGATRAQEQARLTVEQKHLASELATSQENLAATEKRRLETADRLKKAQLEIYTLKAEVGDMVAELKRLKRAPAQSEPTQD